MDRPRVLWLIKGLGPGGAEQLLVNQARVRDRDRIDLEVDYLVPWKDHHVDELLDLGVPVTCLDGPREVDPRWALRLRRQIVHGAFEVIHVHSPYVAALTRLLLLTIPRRSRPALVYTEHNRWARHARPTRWMNRLTMGLDDLDLTVSEDVRQSMPTRLGHRAQVLVHGIDVATNRALLPERAAVRRELGLDDSAEDQPVVIGIVANFRREKNYELWLEAAELALDRDPSLHFVSVGQGPLEDDIRSRVARSRWSSSITLLGYRPDALRVMTAFDLFTLTSTHEGLPVSLMDALSLGIPVVAAAVGGIPEAITDGVEGRLVDAPDPERFADVYVGLARDRAQRDHMASAGLERSRTFDVVVTQRRLEATYSSMVERRRS